MIQKYSSAIFDLDGTLLDTIPDILFSVNHTLSSYGFSERSYDEILSFVGNGMVKLCERVLPENAFCDKKEFYNDFIAFYKLHCAEKTCPFDGVLQMLEDVKKAGMKIAVVSNKIDSAVKFLCDKYFPSLIDTSVGVYDGMPTKPDPAPVREVLRRMNANVTEAIYVGDSDVDILTAKNSCLPCISVTWGFRTVDFLVSHGAKTLANSPKECTSLILGK